jgi:cell division FtsZ-interacting protein ZapD
MFAAQLTRGCCIFDASLLHIWRFLHAYLPHIVI